MSGILDFIRDEITPETINSISNEIGEDPAKTREAVDASVPLIAGAISTQEVAQATGDAAGQPAMFGGLGDMLSGATRTGTAGAGGAGTGGLGGVLGGMLGGAGGGMLESILGGRQTETQTEIAQKSGIEPQKVMRILTMLAPIVLSAYARYKQASPASPDASQTAERTGGGVLGDIIDRVT
jgi:hypothetical protein